MKTKGFLFILLCLSVFMVCGQSKPQTPKVLATWRAVHDSDLSHYMLFNSTTHDTAQATKSLAITDTSYTYLTLKWDVKYYFWCAAYDIAGNMSLSDMVEFTPTWIDTFPPNKTTFVKLQVIP